MAPPSGTPPAAAARGARPAELTREQHNVVRFIARHYRVAVDSAQHFVAEAYHSAHAARLDPHLVLAVMSIESSFNPFAQSNQGAKGLMQVLARVHREKFEPFGGARAAFDPVANIRVGTAILKDYLARAGSVPGALKWYVGAAQLGDDRGYGAKVLFERTRIAAAAAGKPVPAEAPRLASVQPAVVKTAWNDRGGAARDGRGEVARATVAALRDDTARNVDPVDGGAYLSSRSEETRSEPGRTGDVMAGPDLTAAGSDRTDDSAATGTDRASDAPRGASRVDDGLPRGDAEPTVAAEPASPGPQPSDARHDEV